MRTCLRRGDDGSEDGLITLFPRQETVRTGVSVVNTSGQDAMVTARLIDDKGQQFGDPHVMSLVAGGQKAQFVEALFPSIPDGFTGTLELSTATEGVISMGLLQTGLVTTSLPSRHYGAWSQSQ